MDGGLLRGHAGEALAAADLVGKLLPVTLVQERFVIEQIQMGGGAALKEVNDALGFRRQVGKSGQPTDCLAGSGRGGFQQ